VRAAEHLGKADGDRERQPAERAQDQGREHGSQDDAERPVRRLVVEVRQEPERLDERWKAEPEPARHDGDQRDRERRRPNPTDDRCCHRYPLTVDV
jgi:hypothetical protein